MSQSPEPTTRADRLDVLIVVTHLLGIGHLTRARTIGRALARAGHRVTLVSGGMPAAGSPDGVAMVQLPPLRSDGADFTRLITADGGVADADYMERRRRRLIETLVDTRPDALLTELFPFGRRQLAAEFDALLAAAAGLDRRPAILASVRDVLVPPSKPARVTDVEERLGRFYDGVLVHGDPAVLALDASWPVTPVIERDLIYTGYVVDDRATPAMNDTAREGAEADDVVVSGGGSAAGLPLARAAIGAAALLPALTWRILLGNGIAATDFASIAAAAPANAVVERVRPDFAQLLERARLSVSMAGYNTMLDLLVARVRSVVVPFEVGRETEQRQRAERFAVAGLTTVLGEAELAPATLAKAVTTALARPAPPAAAVSLEGNTRTVTAVEATTAGARARVDAWRRLERTLDRAAAAGRSLDFWWRDDDAVAATPALDRLLALAAHHTVSVALAVIPEPCEESLAQRLQDENLVHVLVHGWSHRNHAPPGSKKAEFGPDRPLDVLVAEASAGLARLRPLFGPKALAVFVPPWNRHAPGLIAGLIAEGFTGFSAWGDPPDKCVPLKIINTDLDPIAWHGGEGLTDEVALLDGLTARIETRIASGNLAPIGLLTHHLRHQPRVWRFCDALLALTAAHPAARWRRASDVFAKV